MKHGRVTALQCFLKDNVFAAFLGGIKKFSQPAVDNVGKESAFINAGNFGSGQGTESDDPRRPAKDSLTDGRAR